jgi:hypothetical protein
VPEDENRRELTTWGEIAEYLGFRVRAAQSYEQHGLPVWRGVGKRPRVWAHTDEIERWKESGGRLSEPVQQVKADATGWPVWAKWLVGAVGVAVLAGLFFVLWSHRTPGRPENFEVNGRWLRVTDARGRLVWQDELPQAATSPDDEYLRPIVGEFADVNGSGGRELAFLHLPGDGKDPGEVRFYSSRGQLLWRWRPQEALIANDGTAWAPPFRLRSIAAARNRVIVVANHPNVPAAGIFVLDARGHVVGIYAHFGHLLPYMWRDVDGDSAKEFVVGGSDDTNGHPRAEVLVFRPDSISGSATDSGGGLMFPSLGAGSEVAALWFPMSRVCSEMEGNSVLRLRNVEGRLEVAVREGRSCLEGGNARGDLVYEMDGGFTVGNVVSTGRFFNWFARHGFPNPMAARDREIAWLKAGVEVWRKPRNWPIRGDGAVGNGQRRSSSWWPAVWACSGGFASGRASRWPFGWRAEL